MLLRDDDSYGPSMLRVPPLFWQRVLSVPQPPVSTLRAVVLLGGNVSPTALRSAVRRSLLDLPVERRSSLSQFWCRQIDQLRSGLPGTQLTVRVVHDRRCPAPSMPPNRGMLRVRVEQDPCDWRGTGGLVRDLADEYQPEDRILVAGAAQVLARPLGDLFEMLCGPDADLTLLAHEDGSPVTLMLMKCRCLRSVPKVGFADLKEQSLPMIASRHNVCVLKQKQPVAMPLRTFSDYIAALRRHHSLDPGQPDASPFEERWKPSFALVERGAEVSNSAQIYDSVVLRGGQVEHGAVLVRSLVCPGARVPRRSVVVDQLVTRD